MNKTHGEAPTLAPRRHSRSSALAIGASVAVALAVAACGSSSKSTSTQATKASAPAPSSSTSNPQTTVRAANVGGLGTVLVNGDGRTLYVLTSEKGGKITCTDDNGCTKVWPDTELPKGTTKGVASSGANASMLSAVKDKSGSLYMTYAGYPLYTFSGDSAAGEAKGQGIKSFGGTWWAITPSGTLVTKTSSTKSASSSGSGAGAAGTSTGGYSSGSGGGASSSGGSGMGNGYGG